jgi:SAM-dependent methyltransferase
MGPLQEFISQIKTSLLEKTFVRLNLANYHGAIDGLKKCVVKRVIIQNGNKLSFTNRYQTKDIVKNYSCNEGAHLVEDWLAKNEFKTATLFTINGDTLIEIRTGKVFLKRNPATFTEMPSLEHNSIKPRLINSNGKPYLEMLKITDSKGLVFNHSQDKFKQINRYVEILSPLLKELSYVAPLKVVDMGAGKGYLTFALYDYLNHVLNYPTQVVGIEYRSDLVELCNDIADKCRFKDLIFKQGTIAEYNMQATNVLIALHACDTATDDAIFKGIQSGADLIVVAPCCHKQIRREIEKSKTKNDLDFLLKHGIFLEREAEMLTDGLRALFLEYAGYSTRIFEFISGEHTPKNVMIVGQKNPKTELQKEEILVKIKKSKAYFGISQHYLENLMGL